MVHSRTHGRWPPGRPRCCCCRCSRCPASLPVPLAAQQPAAATAPRWSVGPCGCTSCHLESRPERRWAPGGAAGVDRAPRLQGGSLSGLNARPPSLCPADAVPAGQQHRTPGARHPGAPRCPAPPLPAQQQPARPGARRLSRAVTPAGAGAHRQPAARLARRRFLRPGPAARALPGWEPAGAAAGLHLPAPAGEGGLGEGEGHSCPCTHSARLEQ